MDEVFSAEGFDRGYKQALTDLLNKYADLKVYDELFVSQLRRDIKALLEDDNGKQDTHSQAD